MTRLIALLLVTVAVLSVARLAGIPLWSALFCFVGIVPGNGITTFEMAFENCTALGYGDVVPRPDCGCLDRWRP